MNSTVQFSKQFGPLVVMTLAIFSSAGAHAQGTPLAVELLPLGKDLGLRSGQTVTPAYEGWYENEDGSIALSFGYYNRNSQEVLNIPVGSANRIIGEIAWHLENQGKAFEVPANRHTDFIIDAIVGDANGNFPPQIRFSEGGPIGVGPGGITAGPMQAKVGAPLAVQAWASDDGKVSGIAAMFVGQSGATPPVDITWFKHQGPGQVSFSEPTAKIPAAGGSTTTDVIFSEAGEYLLRARVTDLGGPEMAGHSQCCWTNSFVKVSVSN